MNDARLPPFDLGSTVGQLRRLAEAQVPAELIPDLLGELERTRAVLLARLVASRDGRASRPEGLGPDTYLTAKQVAQRLNVSTRWVYQHAKDLGGFGTQGMVRFPASRVDRYVERTRKR